MDIGCRWTRICCGTSDVRSSLSCPVGCYRKSQTKAGTEQLGTIQAKRSEGGLLTKRSPTKRSVVKRY
jgi:hypothetical protein